MVIPLQEIQIAHKSGQKEPKLLFDAHGLVTWFLFSKLLHWTSSRVHDWNASLLTNNQILC